jgi:predicted nucleotidyltransferase
MSLLESKTYNDPVQRILEQISFIVADELECTYRLFLFGSRADDNFENTSDIDIGIIPDNPISPLKMANIQDKIDQIPTLLKIDLVDFNTVGDSFKTIALKHTIDI